MVSGNMQMSQESRNSTPVSQLRILNNTPKTITYALDTNRTTELKNTSSCDEITPGAILAATLADKANNAARKKGTSMQNTRVLKTHTILYYQILKPFNF
jgi:hypothetical protein